MIPLTKQALMITAFVGVMMLVIEYVNVLTRGQWQDRLSRRPWGQYLLASFLGATPGCLGAFAVVAMYAHRRLSLGAVVAAMVATSGDETFVMLAMIPRTALGLTAALLVIGWLAGALTDRVLGHRFTTNLSCAADFQLHADADCRCFPRKEISSQWRRCSSSRGILTAVLLLFLLAVSFGQVGPEEWNWIRISLLVVTSAALFIVATVPDHFLEEHLWGHVMRGHVPRVFAWTFGALLAMHLIEGHWQVGDVIRESPWMVLVTAALVGLIPESGPHLIFVTLFAQGLVPFSVLLASSIVQDGHGMLPMLAHSRRAFVVIKLTNLAVGLTLGALVMALGG